MNPPRVNDGIPHTRAILATPVGGARPEESWSGANDEKVSKLRVRGLERRARAKGVQLRHSATGYALIDAARKPIDDRHDLTMDEVEAWLERG